MSSINDRLWLQGIATVIGRVELEVTPGWVVEYQVVDEVGAWVVHRVLCEVVRVNFPCQRSV